MSNYYNIMFKEARNIKPRNHIIQSLTNSINSYSRFCIVEGSTDKPFYSNINDSKVNQDIKYLWNVRDRNDDTGKEAVISSYNRIIKDKNLEGIKKRIYKCVFIIDKDYDGAKCMNYEYNPMCEKCISITKGYSFENYFLEENNVKKIFNYLKLTNKDLERFEEKYKQFIQESTEYFRLRSSFIEQRKRGSECYSINGTPYKSLFNISKEIFVFNFDKDHFDGEYFNKNNMKQEIEQMRKEINRSRNTKALYYYNKISKEIIKKRDNLRGHEAMNFLIAYLRDIFGIKLIDNPANNLFIKLVKLIEVDMKFVNGMGKEIK